jgi:DNA-3-methyladenine glycosylase
MTTLPGNIFPESFYLPGAAKVAPDLLGHFLLRKTPAGWAGGILTETEAYLQDDPACHSYKGKTPRNAAMWGPPGRSYVYLIYGNHYCFNTVCGPEGSAEAVLVRAIEPLYLKEWLLENRPVTKLEDLTTGPGKLCQALRIDRDLDHSPLTKVSADIVVAKNPNRSEYVEQFGPIDAGPRVGITKAADLPLRFYLSRSRFISRGPTLKPKVNR